MQCRVAEQDAMLASEMSRAARVQLALDEVKEQLGSSRASSVAHLNTSRSLKIRSSAEAVQTLPQNPPTTPSTPKLGGHHPLSEFPREASPMLSFAGKVAFTCTSLIMRKDTQQRSALYSSNVQHCVLEKFCAVC
jgi:hypothetical protein